MSLSLAENFIVAGADNRPLMLDKTNYSSWASRMLLYIKGKEHGKLLVDSVLNGPFQYGTIVEPGNETTPATPQVVTHSPVVHQQSYQAPALQHSYQAPAIHQPLQQSSSTELDSGLVVLSFNPTNDPISNLNKLMAFVTTTFAPRFPQTNNQLRTSSNPRNQATIQDGRVTVQIIQERQTQGYGNNRARNTATNQGVNRQGAAGQARVVKCYNYQEEGAYLDPEQLVFLADNGDIVIPAQASQEILTPAAFQTNDLDDFDVPLAKAVLMANLSSYESDVLLEESKQKEDKYLDEVIYLQKKDKALDNVVYKIVPALYDGHTIVKTHAALSVTDTEETLELAEESRLKMLAKQNDPSLKEKKVNIAPVDYVALNKLSEHFEPHKQLLILGISKVLQIDLEA
ncbi:hypothetical protein Tco_0837269 [Tanacetum coccineum]